MAIPGPAIACQCQKVMKKLSQEISYLQQGQLLHFLLLPCMLPYPLSFQSIDLCPPEPVLVKDYKAIDNNGDGEGQDEDARESTEPSNHLAPHSLGIEIIAHGSESHQAPPEGLHHGPGVAGVLLFRAGGAVQASQVRVLLSKIDQTRS